MIVEPKHYRWWLVNKLGSELFEPAPNNPAQEALKINLISNLINGLKMDAPRCIEPVQIGREVLKNFGDGIEKRHPINVSRLDLTTAI